ncbi:MAG TPA: hypothetical protein VNZ52_08035, partial [Candidatus Thermoplasmatota archaeon]|nr:hypothetical protein [Candidatus Thermoplasmatota archaeon]
MPRPDPPLWRGWALALLLGGALLAGCVESPPPRAAANPAATAQGLWESPQEAPHPLEGSWAGRGLKLTGAPGVEADTLVLYPTARTPWIVEGPVSVSTPQGTAVEVAAVHLVPFREPVTVGRVTGRASVALDAGGTLRLGESGERVALGFEEPLLLRGTVTLPDYSGPATVRAPRGILSLEGPLPAALAP